MVQEWFGLDYKVFSFPHDDVDIRQEFFDKLLVSGENGVEVFFGTQNQKSERANRMFHRFNAERPDIPIDSLVKGMLLYNLKKRNVKRNDSVSKFS